ncbi:MAG TPA: hypothetical protein VGO16_12800 [Pseudonocardiaceae bacterium]|nr:hypothetical protein [Pseudonocardiaceae bacterium]
MSRSPLPRCAQQMARPVDIGVYRVGYPHSPSSLLLLVLVMTPGRRW